MFGDALFAEPAEIDDARHAFAAGHPGEVERAEAETVRQVFNDTGAEALRRVVGAPPGAANTLEMT